ncbi:MAG: DUF748 domain-containing protein [Rhodoferax sp.]
MNWVRWRKRALGGVGALLALWLLAWVALPPLLRSQLEQQASAALGRGVQVQSVSVQPWRLALALEGLQVDAAQAGQPPLLQVQRVEINASLESLLRWAPVLESVQVLAPRVRLTHLGGGHYDIDDLLQRLSEPPSAAPSPVPRFALSHLQLDGGEVLFTDQGAPGAPTHQVRDIALQLPFASSLPAQAEREVQPRLAWRLGESRFDSAAQATPSAAQPRGQLQLRVAALDLGAYRAYWPAVLPLRLHSGVLDADLQARFVQQPLGVQIRGEVQLKDLALHDAQGQPVLAWEQFQVQLGELDPVQRRLVLQRVQWQRPALRLWRDGAGRVQPLESLFAIKTGATSAHSTRAGGQKDQEKPAPWSVQVETLELGGGVLRWHDALTQPVAQLAVQALELQASGLRWPQGGSSATARLSAQLSAPGVRQAARLALDLQGALDQGRARLELQQGALALARPYLAQWLVPQLDGRLDLQAQAQWQGQAVQAQVEQLRLADVALREGGQELATLRALQLRQLQLDPARRSVRVGALQLSQPSVRVARLANGQWQALQWLRQPPSAAAAAPAPGAPAPSAPRAMAARATPSAVASPPTAAWDVRLQELRVDGGALAWHDASTATPVALQLSGLGLRAQGLALDGRRAVQVQLDTRLGAGRVEPGRLRFQGELAWAPQLRTQGQLTLEDAPAHALVPYMAERLALEVLRAEANFDGKFAYEDTAAGAKLELQGDALLEDFRANTVRADDGRDELLSWKALTLPGVRLRMAPGEALQLGLREVTLSDFYARLIVSPQGRLNLQDLLKPAAPPAPGAGASAGAPEPAPEIEVGAVTLAHGRVLFSDRFIQPNYSAHLSELNGRLSRLSSRPVNGAVELAELELRGRAEGTATLFVAGKLNPLVQPLVLDIQGKVRDLELSPLSPYAVKYAGYGIERGKLNVDVGYKLSADGQLQASNNIVLKQLQFGDKVEGAPHSLPVKLAVALLADSNGVIDIDLPISGSLNDPQFKLGAVIWKVITNLIAKAVTAPFKLLAGLFGDNDAGQGAAVAFAYGQSVLDERARTTLDSLAQSLAKRPAITLTVVGSADLVLEREALQRERLRGMLLAEKRRRVAAEGGDAAAVTTVEEGEYARLLAQVYKRADIKKPRNLVGLAKDLPDAEMEKLLMASVAVSDEAVRELALRRGVAVKDYLLAHQVPSERVFLGAVRTSGFDETWAPRADLSLGM